MASRLTRLSGNILIVLGGLILLATVAVSWGTTSAEQRYVASVGATATTVAAETEAELRRPAPTSTPVTASPSPVIAEKSAVVSQLRPASKGIEVTPASAPTVVPASTPALADLTMKESPPSPTIAPTDTPAPTPTQRPLTIRRIVAPAIRLDSLVVNSPIVNGEWTVPKFVAGYLEGTALPMSNSNVVLSGHVQSISSGNVFARIFDLKTGNRVTLYTDAGPISYEVVKSVTVKNTDLSVVAPTDEEQLTLITCTGAWNPITNDYAERYVVIAKPAKEATF